MNKIVFFMMCSFFLLASSCKDKEPKITETIELSEEMKAYFVDYEVGTKWIYQDTIDPNNFDTIELVSKESFDVVDGNTLQKGYELYYKPKKSKDFKVRVSPGINNKGFVKMDPMVTAAGAVVFENENGKWTTRTNYYDSIKIGKTTYYNVVESESNNTFHYLVKINRNNGMIFFSRMKGGGILANYKLIKTIKS